MQFTLDHAGMVSGPGDVLPELWRRLGFSLTTPEELISGAAPGGVPIGQRSCHAVMADSYIELSEVYSTDPAHHLAHYLRRGAGLHILALGALNIALAHRELVAAGVPCSAMATASRPIAYGARHGVARFEWFMVRPEAAPEGLLCVVRNHTPELVFQPAVTTHPNSAMQLVGVVIACRETSETARRYARLLGVAAQNEGDDLCLPLSRARIVLRDMETCMKFYGTDSHAAQDRFAALLVSVRDMSQTRAWLHSRAVSFREHGATLVLSSDQVGGSGLVFVPQSQLLVYPPQ